MKRKEIEKKKVVLDKILQEEDAGSRLEKLKALAKEVGASVTKMGNVQTGHDAARIYYNRQNVITESEIVDNIQESLQTHVMIDMCNTAARNFLDCCNGNADSGFSYVSGVDESSGRLVV